MDLSVVKCSLKFHFLMLLCAFPSAHLAEALIGPEQTGIAGEERRTNQTDLLELDEGAETTATEIDRLLGAHRDRLWQFICLHG